MPDTFVVGDKEYSQDELESLVGLGQYAQEMEQKYNTKFENAWSAYGKSQAELAELRKQREQEKQQPPASADSHREVDPELIDRLASERGYVKRDDLPTYVSQQLETTLQAREIAATMRNLESEISGEDGRPKFDAQEMISFMEEKNIADPELAYKIKYESEIDNWKAEQLNNSKPTGMATMKPRATDKQPEQPTIDRFNLGASIKEALGEGSAKV